MKAASAVSILDRYSRRHAGSITVQTISAIQPISTTSQLQPTTMYYGHWSSEISILCRSNSNAILLVVVNDRLFNTISKESNSNVIYEFDSEEHLRQCVEELSAFLSVETSARIEANSFYSQLLMMQTLSSVIDSAASFFGVPLIVGSPGGRKILAISGTKTAAPDDPLWASMLQTREFSVEQHCFDMSVNYGKDFKTNAPYYVHYPNTDKWRILSKIFDGEKYLGLLYTYDVPFEKLQSIDVDLFRILSEILPLYIKNKPSASSPRHFSKSRYLISLLGDMLDADAVGKPTFLPEEFPYKDVVLLNISLKKYDFGSNSDGYLLEFFRNLFVNSICFYYRRNVILLLNQQKDWNVFQEKQDFLVQEFKKYRISGILSEAFSNINDLKAVFLQTERIQKIIECLGVESAIVRCNDYKFYDLVLSGTHWTEPELLYSYCDSELLNILANDTSPDKANYKTLREYILTNKSLSATAHNLFLHKSTVAYRIRQIKEQYDINLDDFQKVVSFYYSILLIDLIEAIKIKRKEARTLLS